MDNDTPDQSPEESHDPLISQRNDNDAVDVEIDMDNITPPPVSDPAHMTPSSSESADTQTPLVVPARSVDLDSQEEHDDGSSGVMPPPVASEAIDLEPSAQTAEFEYDKAPPPPPPPPPPDAYGVVQPPAPQAQIAAQPPTRSGGLFFLGVVAAAALGAALTIGVLAVTGTFDDQVTSVPTTIAAAPPGQSTSTETITPIAGTSVNPTAVANKVLPGIVTVIVFADENATDASGSGSGVVMSADGYIITNHHVIDDANSYEVTFEDGRIYTAELVGSDDLTDIAVLKISSDDLTPVAFGSTDALSLGDPSIAIGNPLGQEGGASITSGIISAFNRRVDFADSTSLFGMIQTDAAINNGSSGGALVNADGELIGITSAIGVSASGPEGIGYAIPIEVVDRITSEIIETGDVIHPFIGVTMQSYFDEAADGAVIPGGAIIISVDEGSAKEAGMEPDDVVIAIAGKTIVTQSDLALAVRLYRVGDVVTFTVMRDGEVLTFDVIMGQRPADLQG
jgi:S1-C subfamily serine protease